MRPRGRQFCARVAKLSRAVTATLGPKGRNVVIDKKIRLPTVTKDGVTVGRKFELEDAYETWAPRCSRSATDERQTRATAPPPQRCGRIHLSRRPSSSHLRRESHCIHAALASRGSRRRAPRQIAKKVKDKDRSSRYADRSGQLGHHHRRVIIAACAGWSRGRQEKWHASPSKKLKIHLRRRVKLSEGMQFERLSLALFVTKRRTMEAELEDAYILRTYEKKIAAWKGSMFAYSSGNTGPGARGQARCSSSPEDVEG